MEWLNWIFEHLPHIYAGINIVRLIYNTVLELKNYKKPKQQRRKPK